MHGQRVWADSYRVIVNEENDGETEERNVRSDGIWVSGGDLWDRIETFG